MNKIANGVAVRSATFLNFDWGIPRLVRGQTALNNIVSVPRKQTWNGLVCIYIVVFVNNYLLTSTADIRVYT